jgi:hypothetical protein
MLDPWRPCYVEPSKFRKRGRTNTAPTERLPVRRQTASNRVLSDTHQTPRQFLLVDNAIAEESQCFKLMRLLYAPLERAKRHRPPPTKIRSKLESFSPI